MLPANDTPFLLERFALFDKQGAETLVVVLKATFELAHDQPPTLAKQQDPLIPADVYSSEPGKSGLLAEGELSPPKPATAITLSAHAVPTESNQREINVGIRVGAVSQIAVVRGNRHWDSVLGLTRISSPEPLTRVPLTWENAFGGADQTPASEKDWEFQPDNHVGKGFRAKKSRRPLAGTPLPNIEHPDHPVRAPRDRPKPVGFCPVPPHWHPRVTFAGTYDERWQQERAPLLPDNFDARFYQTAPAGLASSTFLTGGESCVVMGTTQQRKLSFALPSVTPGFRLCWRTGTLGLQPRLDAVHVDTDRMRLHLLWRAAEELHGKLETLQRIEAFLGPRRP